MEEMSHSNLNIMDFDSIKQFVFKKGLFSDILFYISISLLISAILCYFVFLAKISSQQKTINQIDLSMSTIGTDAQKQKESLIFNYQGKINDFSSLLQNRKSSLNILSLLEQDTMPKVWFNRFNMSEKDRSVVLSGEAESMEVLSRQVMVFESNNSISKIDVLSSTLGDSGRVSFNLNVVLDSKVFAPMQPALDIPSINIIIK